MLNAIKSILCKKPDKTESDRTELPIPAKEEAKKPDVIVFADYKDKILEALKAKVKEMGLTPSDFILCENFTRTHLYKCFNESLFNCERSIPTITLVNMHTGQLLTFALFTLLPELNKD